MAFKRSGVQLSSPPPRPSPGRPPGLVSFPGPGAAVDRPRGARILVGVAPIHPVPRAGRSMSGATAETDRRPWLPAAVGLLLAGAIVALYFPALGLGFVNFDDDDYVYRNPRVQRGLTLDGLRW